MDGWLDRALMAAGGDDAPKALGMQTMRGVGGSNRWSEGTALSRHLHRPASVSLFSGYPRSTSSRQTESKPRTEDVAGNAEHVAALLGVAISLASQLLRK